MSFLYTDSIVKNYANQPVIKDISISIEKDKIVSILGTSGVGKTTLFNVLAGAELPDHGSVYLNNTNITGTIGKIAYMQQKDLLFPHKTVINNIILPLVLKRVDKELAYRQALALLKEFELDTFKDYYPSQLSGGMKQRVAFLRTILDDKDFILLDEPFSALDLKNKKELQHWLLKTLKSKKLTALFITHDIDEALYLSDKIYILAGVPGMILKEFDVSKDFNTDEINNLKLEIISSMSY